MYVFKYHYRSNRGLFNPIRFFALMLIEIYFSIAFRMKLRTSYAFIDSVMVLGNIHYRKLNYTVVSETLLLNKTFFPIYKNQLKFGFNEPYFKSNNPNHSVFYYPLAFFRQIESIIKLKNICTNSNGSFYAENHNVLFWDKPNAIHLVEKLHIKLHVDKLVCVNTNWQIIFGHFIYDYLTGILLIPEKYFEDAYILGTFNETMCKQYLKILGFNESRVIFINDGLVFAKELIFLKNNVELLGRNTESYGLLAETLRKRLNLDKIEPNHINFLNRINSYHRTLVNLSYIIEEGKNIYPEYIWNNVNVSITDITEFAKIIASSKVLVTPQGSSCANTIFMKKGTGIIVLSTCTIELAVSNTYYLDIFMIYYRISEKSFYEVYEIEIQKEEFFSHLSNILSAINNGKYASTEKYTPFLDMNYIKQHIDDFDDYSLTFDEAFKTNSVRFTYLRTLEREIKCNNSDIAENDMIKAREECMFT